MEKVKRYNSNSLMLFSLVTASYMAMILINLKYAGLILIAAYFLGGLLLKPEQLFQMYVFCMFFNYPMINAIGIWVVFIAFLLKPHEKVRMNLKSTLSFAGFFMISVLLSTITAADVMAATNEIYTWIYAIGVILCCRMCSNFKVILKALYVAGIVLAVFYLGRYLSLGFYPVISKLDFLRVPDYNYSAIIIFCALPIGALLRKKADLCYVISQLLLLAGVIATNSRGVMALVVLYYIVLFFQNTRFITNKKVIFFVLFALVFLFGITRTELFAYSFQQMSTIFKSDFYSNTVRIELYMNILTKMVPYHFFLGIGPNNFRTEYIKYFTMSLKPDHAHNVYLHVLTEEGILGFIIVCAYLLVVVRSVWKAVRCKCNRLFLNVVLTTVVAYAAYGMVEQVIGDSRSLSMFLIILTIYELEMKRLIHEENSLLKPEEGR